MALQRITYENKTALLAQPSVANINKISDTDMNEIKTVVNAICDATDSNTTNISNANTKITNLENKTTVKAIIDVVYPVGSIYISKESVNPGTLWPGTSWTREAEGRCIIGVGTGYPTAGATGGSSTVTLATTQIPSHAHTTPNHTHTWSGTTSGAGEHSHSFYYPQSNVFGFSMHTSENGNGVLGKANYGGFYANVKECYASINGVGNHTHTYSGTTSSNNGGNTGSTGGGGSHNNMQPYIVMYIWRRTA